MNYEKYIEEYKANIEKYEELGESILPFKSFGAKSGVYQERCGTTYMVRPRTTGGIVDKEMLRAIKHIADEYSDGTVRISTRQDFQFHKVSLLDTAKVMDVLKTVGLYSIGTGGNTTRNVAASPLSGLEEADGFDITEYAKIAGEYISEDENNMSLPRKFKTAFSSSLKDTGSVSFSDIGFVARTIDGEKKFDVYGGGGLGPAPRVSMLLDEYVNASDMLYYLDAMVEFFRNEGDRENRGKARLRHLVKKYGEEEFKIRYYGYLKKSASKELSLDIDGVEKTEKTWANKTKVRSVFLEETACKGIYAVYVHPQGGRLKTGLMERILDFLDELDYETEIRLTPTQGMFIRDLGGSDAKALIEILRKEIEDAEISKSICCVGADTCRVGINPSQELLKEIFSKLKRLDLKVKRELPKLYISGCPSSCGQHQIGAISFSGKRKNIDGESKEAYSVYFGGRLGFEEEPRFAERYGDLLREDIPEFLKEIAYLKYESNISDIYRFIEEKDSEIRSLVSRYGV